MLLPKRHFQTRFPAPRSCQCLEKFSDDDHKKKDDLL